MKVLVRRFCSGGRGSEEGQGCGHKVNHEELIGTDVFSSEGLILPNMQSDHGHLWGKIMSYPRCSDNKHSA